MAEDMKIYDVPFEITGLVRGIKAESPEHAKAIVDTDSRYSEVYLADKYGILETYVGERERTLEQYRRERELEALFKEASLG